MSVVVVATVHPQPGLRPQVIALLEETIGQVHTEPGCELYALHEGEDGRLVLVEKWASRQALDVHLGRPSFAGMGRRLRPLLSRPTDVQVLTPHPAGTARQGTVPAG